jgi:hypothetical protein
LGAQLLYHRAKQKASVTARTNKILAPKKFISEATQTLNNIMPHPQQMKMDAQNVAEKMNSKMLEMILQQVSEQRRINEHAMK